MVMQNDDGSGIPTLTMSSAQGFTSANVNRGGLDDKQCPQLCLPVDRHTGSSHIPDVDDYEPPNQLGMAWDEHRPRLLVTESVFGVGWVALAK